MTSFNTIVGELRSHLNSIAQEDPQGSRAAQEDLREYLSTLDPDDDQCLHQIASYLEPHPQNPFSGNIESGLRAFILNTITRVESHLTFASVQGNSAAKAHLKLAFFMGSDLVGYISNVLIWDRETMEVTLSGDSYRKQRALLSKAFRVRITQDASPQELPGVPGLHLGCLFMFNEILHLDPYAQKTLLTTPFSLNTSTYALPTLRESLSFLHGTCQPLRKALNKAVGDSLLPFK